MFAAVEPASALPREADEVAVAIVGAGACGLVAALALREAGIECLLLERDARAGGSTALSSGFIPAAPTRWQLDAGVIDSAAAFAADIRAKTQGRADDALLAACTAASAPALELLARHGLEFELLDGFLYPGHSVRRMHTLRERTGAALMAALEAAARAAGADLLMPARVRTLFADRLGCVHGLAFERPDGRVESLRCTRLLLACNGFGGNPALVRRWLPEMRDAPFAGHAGNDGSAVAWGEALGAALADLGGYQGHGSWVVPQGALMSWAVMMDGGVQVNARGERFHDETAGYSEAAVQVLAQPGGIAWNVFDERGLALARGFPDFRDAEAAGALRSANDIDGLARIIGCEAGTLAATLASIAPGQHGSHGSDGSDRLHGAHGLQGPNGPHGRRFERALVPPWHAVKVTGALFHTQGGLVIDAHCRVQRTNATPFPNLWAAGGAARGVSGDAVWGYLSGNGLLSAVAGGLVAARSIAASLGGGRVSGTSPR